MITDCTAIIMAGGDSRRMGRDKANVTLGEKTLLQTVTATMQQLFPQVIVSVRQQRAGIDLPQICDEQSNGGPLAGLAASLGQSQGPSISENRSHACERESRGLRITSPRSGE